MKHIRWTATGAALAGLLLIACRDAPTYPEFSTDSIRPSFSGDSGEGPTGPASILAAWTELSFYDGSRGGEPLLEIEAGMVYVGNKATMETSYSITGPGTSRGSKIVNHHDALYNPALEKRFAQNYQIPTGANCGLHMEGDTQHSAWWDVWLRIIPNAGLQKDFVFTRGTVDAPSCEPGLPEDGHTGGGSGGGWVTIETCHYWAHYVNGALVDIELRYCEYDLIPVADE